MTHMDTFWLILKMMAVALLAGLVLIMAVQGQEKQPEYVRMDTMTWDLEKHVLNWQISEGSANPDGTNYEPLRVLHFSFDANTCQITANGSKDYMPQQPCDSLHNDLDELSTGLVQLGYYFLPPEVKADANALGRLLPPGTGNGLARSPGAQ